jgi:hypothetical protein
MPAAVLKLKPLSRPLTFEETITSFIFGPCTYSLETDSER